MTAERWYSWPQRLLAGRALFGSRIASTTAVAIVASVQFAAASPPSASSGSSERARMIFGVTMADDVAEEGPVRPANVFPPQANPIFVWFRHDGLAPNETVTCDLIYEDVQPPVRISQAWTLGPSPKTAHCSLEPALGKPWPVGRYRIELRVNEVVVAETRYRVEDAGSSTLYSNTVNGYEVVAPPGWTVNDQVDTGDVQMNSPRGDGLIQVTSGTIAESLDPLSFAIGWESASVGPGRRLLVKRAGREANTDGEKAYEGVYEGEGVLVKVLFVGTRARFWVIVGVFRNDVFATGELTFDRMVSTFKMKR